MNDKNTPAFPNVDYKQPAGYGVSIMTITGGMTLRDYFAAQALAWAGREMWSSDKPEHVAERAYRMADAMMEARHA